MLERKLILYRFNVAAGTIYCVFRWIILKGLISLKLFVYCQIVLMHQLDTHYLTLIAVHFSYHHILYHCNWSLFNFIYIYVTSDMTLILLFILSYFYCFLVSNYIHTYINIHHAHNGAHRSCSMILFTFW